MLLKGKVTLILGAATGIGAVGARLFANEGANVVIGDINDQKGQEVINSIKVDGNEATYVHCDARSTNDIKNLIEQTVSTYNNIDLFWHNAGLWFPGHIDHVKEDDYDQKMAADLKAAVFGTQYVLPKMRESGGGSILFTSSMVGLRPTPYSAEYSLTHIIAKSGLVMLVRALTEVLAKDNIRVNCICPGPTSTEHLTDTDSMSARELGISVDEFVRKSTQRIPLSRYMTMQEIANVALFLCSDQASAITGVALPVDGGFAAI